MEEYCELPPGAEGDVRAHSGADPGAERRALDTGPLPRNLGERVFGSLPRDRCREREECRSEVTALVPPTNLPVL
ncbi:hypothetical protein [Streptomyces sp. KMM 9044]|uniref:hypothetical protein n=1 Tax=Streptomyces sp. KMM 9044 TaxID=2744474 RepID=UPI00217318A6